MIDCPLVTIPLLFLQLFPSFLFCSETFPSGILTLDFALGGGIPKGRIVEVYLPLPVILSLLVSLDEFSCILEEFFTLFP